MNLRPILQGETMSLSKVLEEIKKVYPYVNEDVDSGPVETMTGRRGRKNQAIESMKRLRRDYVAELLQSAAFIVVVGDKRDAFSSVAVENYKCFSDNPESFYKGLVDKVSPSLYLGKEGMSNIFDVLGRYLEDKASSLDIVVYPQLIFRQEYAGNIGSKEDFLTLVKRAVTEQVGGEVVGIQAVHNLVDVAIKREHAAKFTPILLPSGDDKFALTVAKDLERLSKRIFIVSAGKTSKLAKSTEGVIFVKDPTNENVENALKTISDSLKK